eukprot:5589880-Pyramimonas_sp.AAC.1
MKAALGGAKIGAQQKVQRMATKAFKTVSAASNGIDSENAKTGGQGQKVMIIGGDGYCGLFSHTQLCVPDSDLLSSRHVPASFFDILGCAVEGFTTCQIVFTHASNCVFRQLPTSFHPDILCQRLLLKSSGAPWRVKQDQSISYGQSLGFWAVTVSCQRISKSVTEACVYPNIGHERLLVGVDICGWFKALRDRAIVNRPTSTTVTSSLHEICELNSHTRRFICCAYSKRLNSECTFWWFEVAFPESSDPRGGQMLCAIEFSYQVSLQSPQPTTTTTR